MLNEDFKEADPNVIKDTKYPFKHAPNFIMSSLDVMVNFAFNHLVFHKIFNCQLKDKEKWEIIIEKIFAEVEEEL